MSNNPPSVSVDPVDAKVNPSERLALIGVAVPASTQFVYEWVVVSGDLVLSRPGVLLSSSRSSTLFIAPGVLSSSNFYSLRLDVRDSTQTGSGTGSAVVEFSVNSPPRGGFFMVSPVNGTALETTFAMSASLWSDDVEDLPISYTFRAMNGFGDHVAVKQASALAEVSSVLQSGQPDLNYSLQLSLVVADALDSQRVVTVCNSFVTAPCAVVSKPRQYASEGAKLDGLQGMLSGGAMDELTASGDTHGAMQLVGAMLSVLFAPVAGSRRILLSSHSAQRQTLVETLFNVTSNSFAVTVPTTRSIVSATAQTLSSLFSDPYSLSAHTQAAGVSLLLRLTADCSLLDGSSSASARAAVGRASSQLYNATGLSLAGAQAVASVLSTLNMVTRGLGFCEAHGLAVGQQKADLDCSAMTVSSVRVAVAQQQVNGSTLSTLGAVSSAYASANVSIPSMTLNTSVPSFSYTSVGGSPVTEAPSADIVISYYKNLFNPYAVSGSANTIAPSMAVNVRSHGTSGSDLPVTGLSVPIRADFKLVSGHQPSPRDTLGRRAVPACVWWNSTDWDTSGCVRSHYYPTSVSQTTWRVACDCSHATLFSVIVAPAGCDDVPYSNSVHDSCNVCNGGNLSCTGCDGLVYPPGGGMPLPKVVDGCGACGGDNSSCAGCDMIPFSGKVFDDCGVCGGDNSSCTGCDGVRVHPEVTRRTGRKPAAYDACVKLPDFPNGVCNGNNATCAGCDGIPNSGKEYDRCGVCAPPSAQSNNCSAATAPCPSLQVRDRCNVCVPFSTSSTSTPSCLGCDGVPRVFNGVPRMHGPMIVDKCGICGGDNATCRTAFGAFLPINSSVAAVGAARKVDYTCLSCGYDRCGVANGTNDCLDCFGVPYGNATLDICGVCGGNNDSSRCVGCDGRVYRRPLIPPRFDSAGLCCVNGIIGCDDVCNSTLVGRHVTVSGAYAVASWISARTSTPNHTHYGPITTAAMQFIAFGVGLARHNGIDVNGTCCRTNASTGGGGIIGADGRCEFNPNLDPTSARWRYYPFGANGMYGKYQPLGNSTGPVETFPSGGSTYTYVYDRSNAICPNKSIDADGSCCYGPMDPCGVCGGSASARTGVCDCRSTPLGNNVLDKTNTTCCDKSEVGCNGLCNSGFWTDSVGICCHDRDKGCDNVCFSGKRRINGQCGDTVPVTTVAPTPTPAPPPPPPTDLVPTWIVLTGAIIGGLVMIVCPVMALGYIRRAGRLELENRLVPAAPLMS